ncbi:MAG: RNA 2'-phosphotransferase [Fluviicola sp.]
MDHKHISKFLSFVLRHKPEEIGIELTEDGWVHTRTLLDAMNRNGKSITIETLEAVVATNSKKRFAFNEDKTMIRANQGHSVKVELGYTEQSPPEMLYHGTATKNLESIAEKGLVKGNRHHVHLSSDLETAMNVGQRHGKPVVFEIDSLAMQSDGFKFYQSENGVWLTEMVPAKYLRLQHS